MRTEYASPLGAGRPFARAVPAPPSRSAAGIQFVRWVLCIAVWSCLIITGCDNRTSDKSKVFQRYFQAPIPTNAVIHKASHWEAGAVGLDEWELILDAELPREFLDAKLRVPAGTPSPQSGGLTALLGTDDAKFGVSNALKDCPQWFKPDSLSEFSMVSSTADLARDKEFVVVTFLHRETTNRFQLWVSDNGWSRLYLDRQTGRIFAHNKFP